MKFTLGVLLVGFLALGLGAVSAKAQDDPFQFEELDYNSQGGEGRSAQVPPGAANQDDPEDLLNRMFSGDEAAPPAQPPSKGQDARANGNGANGAIKNLPGEPSPVAPPAQPGEAKIERSNAGRGGGYRGRHRKASDYEPFQRRWYEAERVWSQDRGGELVQCSSILAHRVLYHIQCVGNLRPPRP
ncbi:MAG: hypothetical protein LBS60_07840 [Deltaproteobacteria bacterium]|jgi:hypothetical protein|nr:hypothetical protein [Deltaproteobacteria bacterium]